jgi:hypothetical protein
MFLLSYQQIKSLMAGRLQLRTSEHTVASGYMYCHYRQSLSSVQLDLMKEATLSHEPLLHLYRTLRCHTPKDSNLHYYCQKNLPYHRSIKCVDFGPSL